MDLIEQARIKWRDLGIPTNPEFQGSGQNLALYAGGNLIVPTGQFQNWLSGSFNPNYGNLLPSNQSELGYASTDQGVNYLNQMNQTIDRLSGIDTRFQMTPEERAGGQAGIQAYQTRVSQLYPSNQKPNRNQNQTPGKVKFINTNGQTTELNGDALTPDAYQKLLDQGYYASESSGNVPDWASVGDVQAGRMNAQLTDYRKQLNDLTAGFQKFMISDETLKFQLDQINSLYDSRIKDMEDINKRREETLNTTGIRLGSRYTGGMFGGIISEEERQGAARITDLQNQKLAAVAQAKEAARSNNWTVYQKQVDAAESIYKEQLTAVKDFNATLMKKNDEIQKAKVQASHDSAIAGLAAQGATASQILDYLNYNQDGTPTGGNFTTEEVDNAMKRLQLGSYAKSNNDLTGLSSDYRTFQHLKDINQLPAGVSDYASFVRVISEAGRKPMGGGNESPFTKAQQADMNTAGLDTDTAILIYQAIQNGHSLDDIRSALRQDNRNPALLDIFDRVSPIYKILGQKNPNTVSDSGFK